MKAIFYPCACFCTVATKSAFAFSQNCPDATENFKRFANLIEKQIAQKRHSSPKKKYGITANSAKNTAFNCKIRKNTALLQIFTKIQHHCKLPQNTSLQKCNKKTARKDSFLRIRTIFFVQQRCNACTLAFTISVLSTFWAKGSATAGRFPTCPEALLRKAQFWTKANTCSNPTQRCRRQGLCCSDRTPLPLCLLQ